MLVQCFIMKISCCVHYKQWLWCLFGILFSSLPSDILCLLLSVCILDSYLFVVNLSNAKKDNCDIGEMFS